MVVEPRKDRPAPAVDRLVARPLRDAGSDFVNALADDPHVDELAVHVRRTLVRDGVHDDPTDQDGQIGSPASIDSNGPARATAAAAPASARSIR